MEFSNKTAMLLAMERTNKHIYDGTVSKKEKARRRKNNKQKRKRK